MAVVRKEKGGRGDERRRRPEAETELEGYQLPTMLTTPVSSLSDCIVFLYGARKIGKTSMVAQAPKTLVLATEVGYRGLSLYKEDIESYTKALVVLRALQKDRAYQTVSVDTVDQLYRRFESQVCKELGIDSLSDVEWGKAWGLCKTRFSDYVTKLSQLNKGLVFISHSTERVMRQRGGEEYDRTVPTMAKQAAEVIEAIADINVCYRYEGERRVLTLAGGEHMLAGHRLSERFRTPDGRRLKNISMGRSPEQAWRNFEAAFHNQYRTKREEDIIAEDRQEEPTKERKRLKLKKKS